MPSPSQVNELIEAFSNLPQDAKTRIIEMAGIPETAEPPGPIEQPVDTVGVKFELAKFCAELRKHNQGVNWETNKQKPEPIDVEDIISDSQRLFDFLIK